MEGPLRIGDTMGRAAKELLKLFADCLPANATGAAVWGYQSDEGGYFLFSAGFDYGPQGSALLPLTDNLKKMASQAAEHIMEQLRLQAEFAELADKLEAEGAKLEGASRDLGEALETMDRETKGDTE